MSNFKTAAGLQFHGTGDVSKRLSLFTVTPGIPMLDAMNSVSCLLSTLEAPLWNAATGGDALEGNTAWLVHHTLESAKAVIDALIADLEDAENAAKRNGGEA